MNARGMWQERTTVYDSGTAMIPAYRGRGVAKELFAFMVPRLRETCDQYLLEVLTSNDSAVSLYRKLGFVETRRFAVFRRKELVEPAGDLRGVSVRRVEQPEWGLFKSFWDGDPSWQNSIDAGERIPNDRWVVGAYVDEACVGYGVVFRPAANLMQLAVARGQRRRGIGSRILASLQAEINEGLRVTNIDEELKGTLAFYEANGFEMVLEQFEMLQDLHDFS
jgi:ribosomal protein S18 acetylase RimI-like enzyme